MPCVDAAALQRPAEEMGAFHEEMAPAGVLLDDAGLRPSRQGWRQRYHLDGRREVVDGPFAETKELIAGFTLILPLRRVGPGRHQRPGAQQDQDR